MEERKQKKESGVLTSIVVIIISIVVEWLLYCGLFKLITLCFNLVFTWKWATGVFLIVMVLKTIFKQDD